MTDRIHVSEAQLRHLISAQFPDWADFSVRRIEPGGWDNCSFRLGDALLVRMPSAARYAGQVSVEQRWLPRLAGGLPVAIPEPVAAGRPGAGYRFPWSVYRWLPGEVPDAGTDQIQLARDLAEALTALSRIETDGAPKPGLANFHRGGDLAVYDRDTRNAASRLPPGMHARAMVIWEEALKARFEGPPVWVHGDVAPGNLLLEGGRLSALIDFGCMAVGDPACDLVMAWIWFSEEAAELFRESLPYDAATWRRAAGWALWKALILLAGEQAPEAEQKVAMQVLERLRVLS